jgi:hypothetical protein
MRKKHNFRNIDKNGQIMKAASVVANVPAPPVTWLTPECSIHMKESIF